MFLNWSFPTFRSTTFIYFHISLQRDDHSCWKFGCDPLRASELVLSKWLVVFLVICCSDFVSRRDLRFLLTLRVDQFFRWSWIMIRWAGCFGIMMDFFKQPRALVQIEAGNLFELFGFFWFFRQILFTSVPLYYFDLKSDWLPYLPFAFGSPPEDSVFFRFLFVTIR